MIPQHMVPAVDLWVTRGLPHPDAMGSFLRAMLTHDVFEAVLVADDLNRAAIVEWVMFLYSRVPTPCHGSLAALEAWHAIGGVEGLAVAEAEAG